MGLPREEALGASARRGRTPHTKTAKQWHALPCRVGWKALADHRPSVRKTGKRQQANSHPSTGRPHPTHPDGADQASRAGMNRRPVGWRRFHLGAGRRHRLAARKALRRISWRTTATGSRPSASARWRRSSRAECRSASRGRSRAQDSCHASDPHQRWRSKRLAKSGAVSCPTAMPWPGSSGRGSGRRPPGGYPTTQVERQSVDRGEPALIHLGCHLSRKTPFGRATSPPVMTADRLAPSHARKARMEWRTVSGAGFP